MAHTRHQLRPWLDEPKNMVDQEKAGHRERLRRRFGENFVSREKFKELSAFAVCKGDVLVTTRGTIGRCAIVPEDAEEGILHPCLMRLQPAPSSYSEVT